MQIWEILSETLEFYRRFLTDRNLLYWNSSNFSRERVTRRAIQRSAVYQKLSIIFGKMRGERERGGEARLLHAFGVHFCISGIVLWLFSEFVECAI